MQSDVGDYICLAIIHSTLPSSHDHNDDGELNIPYSYNILQFRCNLVMPKGIYQLGMIIN